MRYSAYWVLGPLLFFAAPCWAGEPSPNEVVCTVNGKPVRRWEVEDRMPEAIVKKLAGLQRRLTDMGRSEADAQKTVDGLLLPVFRQTLRVVVKEKLMLQEALRQGMQVSPLLVSETFERQWEALKARDLAGKPGYEERTVRERVYRLLLLRTFRQKPEVGRDEDAWFREALKRSKIEDRDGQPVEMAFFFPNDRPRPTRQVTEVKEPTQP